MLADRWEDVEDRETVRQMDRRGQTDQSDIQTDRKERKANFRASQRKKYS